MTAKQAGELRDGFKFRGGHLALDLAATVAQRLKPTPKDLLATPEALARWLVAAGLSTRRPDATDQDLAMARELRESLYRLALARHRGTPVQPGDVATVNRWAAEPPPVPQLGPAGVFWIRTGVRAMLATIARAGVELLGGEQGDRIHGWTAFTAAPAEGARSSSWTRRAPATAAGARWPRAATRPRSRNSGGGAEPRPEHCTGAALA
jgi:predicted RNA-binding Zn ribbon-like protein